MSWMSGDPFSVQSDERSAGTMPNRRGSRATSRSGGSPDTWRVIIADRCEQYATQ